jgi:hypothetical protein
VNRDAATSPETIVELYYRALLSGDMAALRQMMLPASYIMTLEAYGLKRSFSDPDFKAMLHLMTEDRTVRLQVENVIAETLRRESEFFWIEDLRTEALGPDRCAVHYTEDGCPKKLTFSKTEQGWKIDYYAGRKRGL